MECVLDMNFIQSEAVQENSNSNENYKNKRVMEVLDYLQEEAYLSDICLSDDPFEILFSSLYDYIKKNLTNIVVNNVEILDDLPITGTGKVKRNKLM